MSNGLICNYADDTTIYVSDYRYEEIIRKLENDTAILSEWFRGNSMKVNAEKYHLIFFSNTKSTNIEIKINNEVIHESPEEKLLDIIFDKTLSFTAHATSLYKKENQKPHALSRIAHFMDSEKLNHIMKAFILSQLNYCPLVYMYICLVREALITRSITSMRKLYELHIKMKFLTSKYCEKKTML